MEDQVSMIAVGTTELVIIVVALATVVYGLMKFFLIKEMKRLSDLEVAVSKLKENSITRLEFNETIKVMREEIRQGNDVTHIGLREVHGRLDSLLLKSAKEG